MNNKDALLALTLTIIGGAFLAIGYTTDFEGWFLISSFLGGVATGICFAKEFLTNKGGE